MPEALAALALAKMSPAVAGQTAAKFSEPSLYIPYVEHREFLRVPDYLCILTVLQNPVLLII